MITGEMFDILFLGTGASVPSRDRSLPCAAVRFGSDITLFDCGEGSQRQLMISPFSFMKINQIFITHIHGDHILGLPGLLQTMGMSGRKGAVSVFGPAGLKESLVMMLDACEGELEYPLEIVELADGDVRAFKGFTVSAFATEHGIPSLGFVLKENDKPGTFNKAKALELGISPGPDFAKLQNGTAVGDVTPEMVIGKDKRGCSVVYTGDSLSCESIAKASMGADVLIHECTYIDKDIGLAKEHYHSTARQAAETAKRCGVRLLLLNHISNRYGDSEPVVAEAKAIFDSSAAPADFQMFTVNKGEIRSV